MMGRSQTVRKDSTQIQAIPRYERTQMAPQTSILQQEASDRRFSQQVRRF